MEPKLTTVERGNRFRDLVAQIFAAAGFSPSSEVQAGAKKSDLRSTWIRHEFEGPVRYLIETKDYNGALPLSECTHFVAEYGTAIRQDHADRAFLISKGAITSAGRSLIEDNRKQGLYCFTFEEFQRNVMRTDAILRQLILKYNQDGIANYYVPPKTDTNHDLETLIRKWLYDDKSAPVAVIGAYGTGKSTFAAHLASTLASEALADPTCRVPILVTLADLVDEQSIEGLIGKTLASQYRVANYHFHLFSTLNECGRFVIIFDGFDEMKHGMTPATFERNFRELLSLDRGSSRIILLGRDTVFFDEREFRAIIVGRRGMFGGSEVSVQNRRACTPIHIDGFSLDKAREFIKRYYSYRMKDMKDASVQARIDYLISGTFDDLLVRPVHAQMLSAGCQDLPVSLMAHSGRQLAAAGFPLRARTGDRACYQMGSWIGYVAPPRCGATLREWPRACLAG